MSNRYEINLTGPDCYSLLNVRTGKYVVCNESMTVCSNVKQSLEHSATGLSECDEVARAIENVLAGVTV